MRYLEKLDNAVSGQRGHDKFFSAALVLMIGFNMQIEQARPILRWFSDTKCVPPFDEGQINHKLESAQKDGRGERGRLLKNDTFRIEDWRRNEPKPVQPIAPKGSAALQLGEYIEEMISGTRYACRWPWLLTGKLSRALMPATVTMISAPPGTSKSLFVMEALQYWLTQHYTVACLMLEDDRNYHMLRALAQIVRDSNVTDDAWCKENADKVRQYWTQNSEKLDALGRVIHEGPTFINTDAIILWIEAMCAEGKRIVVVDPITAKDPSEKPWIDDHRFVARVKDIIKKSGTSLVLVTHPPTLPPGAKMQSGSKVVGGGAAYEKFSQTVIYLSAMDPEMKPIETQAGVTDMLVNRRLFFSKTRNGKGQWMNLGFYFDPTSLLHVERGILRKD